MSDTEGAVLDSGAMMGIIPGAQGNGKCVQLTVVTGHTTSTEVSDVVYPILTESKKPDAFATRGTTFPERIYGITYHISSSPYCSDGIHTLGRP
jgi:hypothetical protein